MNPLLISQLRMFGEDMRAVHLIHQRQQVIRLYSRPVRHLGRWRMFWSSMWQMPYACRIHGTSQELQFAFLPGVNAQLQADIIATHQKSAACTSTSDFVHS